MSDMTWDEGVKHDVVVLAERVQHRDLTPIELAQQAAAGIAKVYLAVVVVT
jgi:amidase